MENNSDKNIIFISGVQKPKIFKENQGAPSMLLTYEGYVKAGYNVFAILKNENHFLEKIVEKDKLFIAKSSFFAPIEETKKIGKFIMRITQRKFGKEAEKIAKKIMSEYNNPTVFYAYEAHGVSAASRLSKKYKMPLITRFQGVNTTEKIRDNFINRIKHFPRFEALETPSDLLIMTDDGTRGNQLVKRLSNNSKLCFWRNGTDIIEEDYQRSQQIKQNLNIKDDEIVIMSLSRLVNIKKVDRAIDLITAMKQNDINVKLIVLGDGSARTFLEQYAEEKGVTENIVFEGAIERQDIHNYLTHCDFFVSFYDTSNLGNPIMEAMKSNCIVVTLDVGDTNTVVKDGYNGIIVPLDDIDTLPVRIMKVYNNPEIMQKMRDNVKKFSEDNLYSWDKRIAMELEETRRLFDRIGDKNE